MRRLRFVAVAATLAGGVAACAVAPQPTPSMPTPSASEPPASALAPTPSATPGFTPLPDLASEIEIVPIDRAFSDSVLEFASTGTSIIASSGFAADAGPDAAPDLWRIVPGLAEEPTRIWRNPARGNVLPRIGGDGHTIAFVDMPVSGERAWNLWLIPELDAEPILLDTHPGDADVSGSVPSFGVYSPIVAWTAFDRGPSGPVSQLLVAEGPDWTPELIAERNADEAELWFPSVYGSTLVYGEVRYAPDRLSDTREVFFLDLADPAAEPRRLDTTGRATMPRIVDADTVIWKEADAGFHMLNWGRMYRHELTTGQTRPLDTWPQEYVNYPTVGSRFAAWWGEDPSAFGIYDFVRDEARLIAMSSDAHRRVLRPTIGGSILVWFAVEGPMLQEEAELRFAIVPDPGADR